LPLKCDLCEGEEKPLCVEWCLNDVLIYEEREEEEVEDEMPLSEIDAGLDALISKYGFDKVKSAVTRMGHSA
jgi:benzoyl-CoA reductase subunit BamC